MVVLLCGAVRAARNPGRYGRGRTLVVVGPGGEQREVEQGRIKGLSQAVLDGFTVVRFGAGGARTTVERMERSQDDDERGKGVELDEVDRTAADKAGLTAIVVALEHVDSVLTDDSQPPTTNPALSPAAAVPSTDSALAAPPNPAPAGDPDDEETCPICVCAFEEGDEVRVLPCHHQHRFHTMCVDPYLLQFSSLCPLCRLDLRTSVVLPTAAADEGMGGVVVDEMTRRRPLAGLRSVWTVRERIRVSEASRGRDGGGVSALGVAGAGGAPAAARAATAERGGV